MPRHLTHNVLIFSYNFNIYYQRPGQQPKNIVIYLLKAKIIIQMLTHYHVIQCNKNWKNKITTPESNKVP